MTPRRAAPFIVALASALVLPCVPADAQAPIRTQSLARNVVVFVGLGLGPATATAARLLQVKDDGVLAMDVMPSLARVKTWSLDAQSSDSAAAVSALLTGVRVRNDVVAMDATTRAAGFAPGRDAVRGVAAAANRCPAAGNGGPSPTLLELAIARGRATGIVTTSYLAGGAAGAAYAHVCHRDAAYEIARQAVPGGVGFNAALGRGVDVLLGGGSAHWRPYEVGKRTRGRPDARELAGELQAQGYTVAADLASLNAAPHAAGSRLFGLFDFVDGDGLGGMSYDADRDAKREPSLADMTSKAIDVLSTNAKGYVLVVEAGRIGQALAAGNARRALGDTLALDEAVKVVMAKVDLSQTLIVATGDHDGTLTLIGGGRRGSDVLGLHLNPVTGKPDVDADGATYTSLVFGTGSNRPDRRATLDTPTVVQKDYVQEAAVRLPVGSNGGGDVLLRAAGAGASAFHGTLDHPRVFALIRRAADL